MIPHPHTYAEVLLPHQAEQILECSLAVLEGTGLVVQSDEAVRALQEKGAVLDPGTGRVKMPSRFVQEAIRSAPRQWILAARNPSKSVRFGGREAAVAPGYGSAFVTDARGRRRPAAMADFVRLVSLAAECPAMDMVGGLLVEPQDVPPAQRPARLTRALLAGSDKPFMGSVAGAGGARQSLEMAEIVFGPLDRIHAVMALINVNSPLRLDAAMAGALVEYVRARQPVLLTPGILMGVTAPVAASGALTQAFAELLGGLALAQAISPGSPVMLGLGGFGADLRSCGPGFGRPENALASLAGAQVARRLGLPFRCSAAVTGAKRPDCRSGYERMMTALAAWTGGGAPVPASGGNARLHQRHVPRAIRN